LLSDASVISDQPAFVITPANMPSLNLWSPVIASGIRRSRILKSALQMSSDNDADMRAMAEEELADAQNSGRRAV
jgi:hypothetical protein